MNNLTSFKEAGLKYLTEFGWGPTDKGIKLLTAASTWEEVWQAFYAIADAVGDRKGWGSEGVGSLHEEMLLDVSNSSKIEFAEEYANELDQPKG